MINPLQQQYDKAKKADAMILYLTIVASIAAIASYGLSRSSCQADINIFDIISCLIMMVIALISFYCDCVHRKAEEQRRKTNVDNAYLTGYADQQSDSYYSNDSQKCGLAKLSINHFESCFFSYHIASEMVKRVRIWTLIVIFVLAIFTFINNKEWYVCICNLGIIAFILSDWIRLEVLVCRTSDILSRYRTHYSTKQKSDAPSRDSERILLALDYEAAVSWSHVLLSEEIYRKNNERLSLEWQDIKDNYHFE